MTKRVEPDDEPNEVAAPTSMRMSIAEPTTLAFTLDPTSGPEQTAILITGTDFGDQPGTLFLNEVPAPVGLWTPLAIQTLVPYGATSGDLVVTTTDGRRGAATFTVTTKDDA